MNPIRHRGRRLAVSALYDGAFKLRIDTTKAGSGSDTFVFPGLPSGGANSFVISWGDGSVEVVSTASGPGNLTHVYPQAGEYVVSIRERAPDFFRGLIFDNAGDKLKVTGLLQWGENSWTTLQAAFRGCSNMKMLATDHKRARTSRVSIWNNAFTGCTAMTWFPPLSTDSATQLSGTWRDCTGLTAFPAIRTDKVTNANQAWQGCTGMAGYNFPFLDLRAITTASTCFSFWGMSTASYSALINGLDALNANTGVTFGGGTSKYNAGAVAAHDNLVNVKTWTIADGGVE